MSKDKEVDSNQEFGITPLKSTYSDQLLLEPPDSGKTIEGYLNNMNSDNEYNDFDHFTESNLNPEQFDGDFGSDKSDEEFQDQHYVNKNSQKEFQK